MFSFAAALFWTTLGSVLGAVVVYMVGALIGRERTRALVVRVPLIKASDFDRTEAWFAKHGSKAVFLGRMVPLFRSFISLPAGIERMGMVKFLILTTLGSLIWNTIFVTAGYQLGENWQLVDGYAEILQKIVVVTVVVAVAVFVALRLRSSRRAGGADLESRA